MKKAWSQFKSTLGTEKILEQSMSEPVLKDQHTFEVVVSNSFQERSLKDNGSRIMSFLKDQLKNDQIQMQVRVSEQEEKKRIYTATDKYNEMIKKNPALEELKRLLDLDLD